MHRPQGTSLLLVLALGTATMGSACQKKADDKPAPDPNRMIWKQMSMLCAENGLTRMALLRVDDKVAHSEDVQRQVGQAILAEITQLEDLQVLETDQQQVAAAIEKHDSDPSIGIPPAMAMELCQDMAVDAFVFATVENNEFDVNMKLYSGATGNIIFTKTLQDLELPGAAKKKTSGSVTEAKTEPPAESADAGDHGSH